MYLPKCHRETNISYIKLNIIYFNYNFGKKMKLLAGYKITNKSNNEHSHSMLMDNYFPKENIESNEMKYVKHFNKIIYSFAYFSPMHCFNFSIPHIEKAIQSKSEVVPMIYSLEDLDNWLNS